MPFLPADPSVDAPNSFLIFRLVFFGKHYCLHDHIFSRTEVFIALLGNLSLLQLIFASWNINASLSMTRSGMSFINVQERRVTMELYNSTFNGYLHCF